MKLAEDVYRFTREELKQQRSDNFKDGDTVICNHYYINITYGEYDVPSLCSTVSTRYDLRNLPIHKQPYYIRDFISSCHDETIPYDLHEHEPVITNFNNSDFMIASPD